MINFRRYPYDELKDPMYEITYVLIALTGNVNVCGVNGLDGIFIALCLYISAQFEIIQYNFGQFTPLLKSGNEHQSG